MGKTRTAVLLLFVGAAAVMTTRCEGGARRRVVIKNSLPYEAVVGIHCKSGDEDVGARAIPANGTYEFGFRDNFFLTTLFFCGFRWEGARGVFDIYKARRDGRRCAVTCNWEVRDDGVHGFTENGPTNDITFFWPPG